MSHINMASINPLYYTTGNYYMTGFICSSPVHKLSALNRGLIHKLTVS